MANARSKNTRSVPSKKASRYRPPPVTPNFSKQEPTVSRLVIGANGKKRMVKDEPK
jgi:hypothetical protein